MNGYDTKTDDQPRAIKMLDELARAFGRRRRIPMDAAEKLTAILERAPDEALALLVQRRVRFCWSIATRILREREQAKELTR